MRTYMPPSLPRNRTILRLSSFRLDSSTWSTAPAAVGPELDAFAPFERRAFSPDPLPSAEADASDERCWSSWGRIYRMDEKQSFRGALQWLGSS